MNVGDVVGNYRITEVLGEGGMGVVYLGSHNLIGREAAIKVLLPSLSNKQDVVQRFFNEAKTTTSIKHPGIVEVFDFGYSDNGHAYIVMERLEGETLDHRIRRLGRLPAEKAISLFGQIGRALGAAHSLGVVHRDLKPANIYIVSDPDVAGGERAKILDFGIAKLRNAGNIGFKTASGQLMGAPDYMAPEQCLGASEVDQRGDLYALGCMLFHAVTGKPPYVAANFSEVLAAHVSKPAPRASQAAPVPEPLDDLIYRLMSKSPDDRPQTTDEVVALLKAASGAKAGGPIAPPPVPARSKPKSAPPPIPPSSRRTVMAPSQPPPVPSGPQATQLPAGVVDTASPLPPLPRPKAASSPPPVPAVPKAPAHARTLYTNPNDGAAAASPAGPSPASGPAPGPFNDPRLGRNAPAPGNPVLSVPGPSPQPASASGVAPVAAPMAAPVAAPAGPRGTMALPPEGAAGPAASAPVYPRHVPEQRSQRPQYPVEMGPRRGNAVRPSMQRPAAKSSGGGWKVAVAVVLIAGASAGGFFVYKSATRKGAEPAVAAAGADAGVATAVVTADAASVVREPPVDAGKAVVATPIDAAPSVSPADASAIVATSIDAAATVAVAPPVDAANVVAVALPDAAPAAVDTTGVPSGRVVDPDLKGVRGGDDGVETVTLTIESKPAGAIVTRRHDKLRIGKTPIQFVTRKFNANENFDILLDGYYPVSIKVSTFRDAKRLVPLLAKRK